MLRLVGDKCTVNCLLGGVSTEALLDTRAQVSLISKKCVNQNLPVIDIRQINELLDVSELNLRAANGTMLPYEGWVEIYFCLSNNAAHVVSVKFLVASDQLNCPIIGYNIIEEITKQSTDSTVKDNFVDSFSASLSTASQDNVKTFLNFIQESTSTESFSVKTFRKNFIIPRGKTVSVQCRVSTEAIERKTPVLFELNIKSPWPIDLEVPESLITVSGGSLFE